MSSSTALSARSAPDPGQALALAQMLKGGVGRRYRAGEDCRTRAPWPSWPSSASPPISALRVAWRMSDPTTDRRASPGPCVHPG